MMNSLRLKLAKNIFALVLFFYATPVSSMVPQPKNVPSSLAKCVAIIEAYYWQKYAEAIHEICLPEESISIADLKKCLQQLHNNSKIPEDLQISEDALRWKIFGDDRRLTIFEMEHYKQDMINYCQSMKRLIRTSAHLD